tara:strand:+ start:717 stop:965 length:249 start_codon:yes stop_codon:yes gene_type:complete
MTHVAPFIPYNEYISKQLRNMKKGLNIEVTSGQYEFLYDLVMMAYELDIPEQKGWDMQTFDNLVDNVCQAQETNLSTRVRGI